MGDEPPGDVAHAGHELDALRRRAYGPDADIFDDPVALARLAELEDAMRRVRAPEPALDQSAGSDRADAITVEPAPLAASPDSESAARRAPRARTHGALMIATAVVAALLGGIAWSRAQPPAGPLLPSAYAKTAAVAKERRDAGYEEGYRVYLDGLRDEVLRLPGADVVQDQMIRDQLRPYGILYGRTVGAGPTVDHEFCMIIADLPEASVTCIPVENAYANPVSVVLPAWYSDAQSDVFTGLGDLVTYTLMPGGGVVAVPVS